MKYVLGFAFLCLFGGFAYWGFLPTQPPMVREPGSVEIPENFFVQDLDQELGESFEDNDLNKEKQYITNVANTFLSFSKQVREKHSSSQTFRGAHGRALSCLKGQFEVQSQNLAENLRVGLFSKNETYKTWIRISNSDQDPFSKDGDQNTRGFAMKLLGVEGKKLIDPEEHIPTLDLLMVAAEAFVARDNFNYSKIADGTETNFQLFLRLGVARLAALLSSVSTAKAEMNPLRLNYFSTVSYRLGPEKGPKQAIKFRIVLCDPKGGEKFPAGKEGVSNLEKNITDTFNAVEEVCYDFKVQMKSKSDNVEDATTKWKSEYKTVAKLRIKKNENSTDAIAGRKDLCENFSLNPWRTLEEHRPLGRINRARKTTYLMSSKFRHGSNRTSNEEPEASSFEQIP